MPGELFGKDDPIGKTITVKHSWATRGQEIDVLVTGIYKDYPSNSHFKPKYLVNLNALRAVYGEHFNEFMEATRFGENTTFFENYIVLKPGADTKPLKANLDRLADQMIRSDSASAAAVGNSQPFSPKCLTCISIQKIFGRIIPGATKHTWQYSVVLQF